MPATPEPQRRIVYYGSYWRPATTKEMHTWAKWNEDAQVIVNRPEYINGEWWMYDGPAREQR